MNRFAAGVLLVAGIALPAWWFWHGKPTSQAEPEHASLAEKLNTIILPEYPTAGLSLEAVVEYLRVKSREYDASTTESGIKGGNIVIIAGGERELPASPDVPLRDVPLAEALRHITSLVNLKYTVERHAVAIREPEDMRTSDGRKASSLQQRLEKVIRPNVSFQDASLEEAVEYLRMSRGCLDIGEEHIIDIPFNFVLHLREGIKRPMVSLDLSDIPMSEALRYCAEISNARLRYDTAAVMITDFETDASVPSAPAASPVLQTVEFSGATLDEALQFVRIKSRELNPDHRETSITVKPDTSGPPISLWLHSISIHETLRYIAELSGLKLSFEDDGYVLSPF
ncbi:hypothetical protein [Prosthecobacter sp.]|uniref:hypothetical protein n=1 Tax=Prosthecobacter sp. TaxID=1965333 RepID=UPI003782F4ED